MLQEAEYVDLIARFLSGNASEEEATALQQWRDASPENARLFESYAQTWSLFDTYQAPAPAAELPKAWAALEARITESAAKPAVRRIWPFNPKTMRFSAVATILLLLATLGLRYWQQRESESQPWPMASCQTGTRLITLPDGSKIWLNAHSRLSWNPNFQSQRQVNLEGEAFFEVSSDKAHPFSIKSGDLQTTVLGTSFNIRAIPGEKTVEVSVATGTVRLTATQHPQKELLVRAGHQAQLTIENQVLEPLPHPKPNPFAWKEERLSFDGTPLPAVLADLERYFHLTIQAQAGLEKCTFYGHFEQPDLPQILQVLQLAMGLEIEEKDGVYYVSGTPCP